jgi:hypothetical protein
MALRAARSGKPMLYSDRGFQYTSSKFKALFASKLKAITGFFVAAFWVVVLRADPLINGIAIAIHRIQFLIFTFSTPHHNTQQEGVLLSMVVYLLFLTFRL